MTAQECFAIAMAGGRRTASSFQLSRPPPPPPPTPPRPQRSHQVDRRPGAAAHAKRGGRDPAELKVMCCAPALRVQPTSPAAVRAGGDGSRPWSRYHVFDLLSKPRRVADLPAGLTDIRAADEAREVRTTPSTSPRGREPIGEQVTPSRPVSGSRRPRARPSQQRREAQAPGKLPAFDQWNNLPHGAQGPGGDARGLRARRSSRNSPPRARPRGRVANGRNRLGQPCTTVLPGLPPWTGGRTFGGTVPVPGERTASAVRAAEGELVRAPLHTGTPVTTQPLVVAERAAQWATSPSTSGTASRASSTRLAADGGYWSAGASTSAA
jgi:hypothetical protein